MSSIFRGFVPFVLLFTGAVILLSEWTMIKHVNVIRLKSFQSDNVYPSAKNSDSLYASNEIYPNYTKLEKLGNSQYALKLLKIANFNTSPLPQSQERILCWVNTFQENHIKRAIAVRDTWGTRCDKIVFLSNVNDSTLPAVGIDAPYTHDLLWQKHQKSLKYIYKTYGQDFEWFFKADDDTFTFVDNLRKLVKSRLVKKYPTDQPLLLGHRMTLQDWAVKKMIQSSHYPLSNAFIEFSEKYTEEYPYSLYTYTPGGGGYAMNSAYLEKAVQALGKQYCFPDDAIPDDVALSICMKVYYNVDPLDTRDEWQRERFHQYSPERVYFEPTQGSSSFWWKSDHIGVGFKNGTECCASDTVAFHYVTHHEMHDIYDAFYK